MVNSIKLFYKRLLEMIINISLVCIVIFNTLFSEIVHFQYIRFMPYVLIVLLILTFLHKPSFKSFIAGKIKFLFWLYVLSLSFGIVFARQPELAVKQGYVWLIFTIGTFFIFYLNFSTEKCEQLMKFFVICAAVISLYGILSDAVFKYNVVYERLIDNSPYYQRYCFYHHRIMSVMRHPNVFGLYLVGCAPLAFCQIAIAQSKWKKIFYIFCIMLILMALILTFARTSFLAIVIVISVYLKKKNKTKLMIWFLVVLFVVVSLCTLAERPSPFYRLGFKGLFNPHSIWYRYSRLLSTMRIVRSHPFFGIGIDNYRCYFDSFHKTTNVPWEWKIPDNMHFMIMGETGLFGFIVFEFFVFFVLKRAFYCFRKKLTDCKNKEIMLALACGVIGILINMCNHDIFYWPACFFLFWPLFAMLAAYSSKLIENA